MLECPIPLPSSSDLIKKRARKILSDKEYFNLFTAENRALIQLITEESKRPAGTALDEVTEKTKGLAKPPEVNEIHDPRIKMIVRLSEDFNLNTVSESLDDCTLLDATIVDYADLSESRGQKEKKWKDKNVVIIYQHFGTWIVRAFDGREIRVALKNSPTFKKISSIWQANRPTK